MRLPLTVAALFAACSSFYGQGVGFGPDGLVSGDAFYCLAL